MVQLLKNTNIATCNTSSNKLEALDSKNSKKISTAKISMASIEILTYLQVDL